ncbi:hypothetical protein CCHL11_07165 [Colletotrichum chlorophyti]|uniref:Uncharacterized protein n=1 Tax=Colletotrichum chlorophyti TaxID=708187 RepID=A0A1Q8S0P5_9PEZI|nr:hypothetical protein CCHL11_07165 [Colletotrichum chlorophyti]
MEFDSPAGNSSAAFFSICFTIQAYTTHLAPDQVMAWMSQAIVLDIGALMQLVFLVAEKNSVAQLWSALTQSMLRPFVSGRTGDPSLPGRAGPCGSRAFGQARLTVLALVLLITLLVLQLISLVSAAQGRNVTVEQHHWHNATVAFSFISLVFQALDAAILVVVGNNTRWRRAKMKRPWLTMFTGDVVLVCVLIIGIISSSQLPTGTVLSAEAR